MFCVVNVKSERKTVFFKADFYLLLIKICFEENQRMFVMWLSKNYNNYTYILIIICKNQIIMIKNKY